MQSKAKTPAEYIKELSPERRRDIETVRKIIKKNLPKGYREMMQWGMLSYAVPLSTYPKGYGGNPNVPLPYIGLASQKNYMSLYLMGTYGNEKDDKWFRDAYKKSGKKLDMGKGCVRFKSVDDLPLDVIAKAVALSPVKKHIETYEKARDRR
jgi:uncharacterized protein YdhG (YjbR/CyaY superfamily)